MPTSTTTQWSALQSKVGPGYYISRTTVASIISQTCTEKVWYCLDDTLILFWCLIWTQHFLIESFLRHLCWHSFVCKLTVGFTLQAMCHPRQVRCFSYSARCAVGAFDWLHMHWGLLCCHVSLNSLTHSASSPSLILVFPLTSLIVALLFLCMGLMPADFQSSWANYWINVLID